MHKAEAQRNGMTSLIRGLQNSKDFCATRLCEEVMQVIGIPLSAHAQARPLQMALAKMPPSDTESYDAVFAEAKKVLGAMLGTGVERLDDAPPAAWRGTLIRNVGQDHPDITSGQMAASLEKITSDWSTFHDLVVEQNTRAD